MVERREGSIVHQEEVCVICNESMGGGYYRMVLNAPRTARTAVPGQFVHFRCSPSADPLLRRPFSVYDADEEAGTVSILYAVVGQGTALLPHFRDGDRTSILGPLGTGFTIPEEPGNRVLIGGGVGIAPLLFLGKVLLEKKHRVKALLGMQSAETAAIVQDFERAGIPVAVATNDGSLGACGHVTCLVDEDSLEWNTDCRIYACGPRPMLQAVQEWARSCGVETELSLEERMGCGVGVCLSCVCKVKVETESGWEYQRVCVEGPVFSAREVILDD